MFAHWLRLQNPARLLTPEAYTLRRMFDGVPNKETKLIMNMPAQRKKKLTTVLLRYLTSFVAFATRTIYISTPDGLRLGAWHILPLSTPRTTLEKIHAIVTQHTRAGSTTAQEGDLATTDSVFEDALINAERVVLYFHGQAGKFVFEVNL